MKASSMEYLPELSAERLDEYLQSHYQDKPDAGILVLLPEAEQAAIPLLQQACARHGVGLVGAVFPALVREGGFISQGAWVLQFKHMPFTLLSPNLPQQAEALPKTLDTLVSALHPHLLEKKDITLFMIFDAMVPNIGSILDELYLRLANRVNYMGVNAGSETFQPIPCLFDAKRIVQNGVLMMLLESHSGAILDHGYEAPENMIAATATEGNHIQQIDWRPAFEVYQEMAREQYGIEINRENFYENAVHFPFGIMRANGVIVVRIPVALEEDGSLFCVGEVNANSMLTLLRAPSVDSAHTIDTLINGLSELNGPLKNHELLMFYCAGRRLHLGIEAATVELQMLQQKSTAGQVAGALSLGEIGSNTQWAYPLFHNASLVATLWDQ